MIRRPRLDIIGLHGSILKLATIKMNGKESGGVRSIKWKTLSQLGKGSVVGALLTVTVGYTNCCM